MPWTQKYIVFDQSITIAQIYATSELCLQVIMAITVNSEGCRGGGALRRAGQAWLLEECDSLVQDTTT